MKFLEKRKIACVNVYKTLFGNYRMTMWVSYPTIFGTTIPYENTYYYHEDLIKDINLIRLNNEIPMCRESWDIMTKYNKE